VELFAQNRLHAVFGAVSGRISLASLDRALAAELRSAFPNDLMDGDRLQLGCAKAFAALKYSISEGDHGLWKVYERLKPALEKRNQSWLAHGTRPAEAADFEQMWKVAVGEFGIAESSIPEWPSISFMDY
jgi:hypothetical protein